MRYRVLEDVGGRRKFVLVLDQGEEVVASIAHFATELLVKGASLTGIGALSHATLGWFNPATKEFRQNEVGEQAEVLAITGNIAEGVDHDGEPDTGGVKLHLHIVLGCGDASVKGGHLVAGLVSPTMELIVEEAAEHLTRGVDGASGLVLLEPRHGCTHELKRPEPLRKAAS